MSSCNGCRVLRKGCSEGCALRPCLQWIDSPESQGYATLFLAKFFGRAGLMEFISAVPHNERTALFQSLLYEACGRTVNPIYGAVGLLWSGKWYVCQEAVETVLTGGTPHSIMLSNMKPNPILLPNMANIKAQGKANPPLITAQLSPIQSDQLLTISKTSITPSNFQSLDEKISFNNSQKKLKRSQYEDQELLAGTKILINRSAIYKNIAGPDQARTNQGAAACNYNNIASARHNYSIITAGSTSTHPISSDIIMRNRESLCCPRLISTPNYSIANHEKAELNLTLNSTDQRRSQLMISAGGLLITRVSSPNSTTSEGSIVTTMESPLIPASISVRHHLSSSPSSTGSSEKIKLLNLLV